MTARVSIGQAAANALVAWLKTQLGRDIEIEARWPDPGRELPPKAVTVIRVGRPDRVDVSCLSLISRENISDTQCRVTYQFGGLTQNLQIDAWATNDADRDDMIAQLQVALTAGVQQTLGSFVGEDPIAAGITGPPFRDGVLVPFIAEDGYTGNVDCLFDEAEINDDPHAIQRKEYRATYRGEAQFAYTVTRIVPRMKSLTFKMKAYQGAPQPAQLFDTATITPNPDPPPASIVTYGQSS